MNGFHIWAVIVFYAGLFGYMAVYAMRGDGVPFAKANHRRAYALLLAGIAGSAALAMAGGSQA